MVFNVGINDLNYSSSSPFYSRWKDMLMRCYSEKYLKKTPSYIGCFVCEEWKYLSNFKCWMEIQDWKGNHLDKDLLYPGNKIYSPDTCIFIPPGLNSFMTNSSKKNTSGFNGVTKDNRYSTWNARIFKNGKAEHIGNYQSREEAFYYYKIERNKEILKWIKKINNAKIKNALKKHLYILDDNTSKFKGPLTRKTCSSKKCSVDEIIYNSAKECSRKTGIKPTTVCYRINSSSFPSWFYVE
jgi:hypothetical protein